MTKAAPIKSKMELKKKAALYLMMATVFWGLSFSLVKSILAKEAILVPGASSWFLTTSTILLRFIMAALLLLLVGKRLKLKSLRKNEFYQGVQLGCLLSMGLIFQVDGLKYTSASVSAFLTQAYCLWIPVTIAIAKRIFPGKNIIFCTILVIVGVGILSKIDLRTFKLGRGEIESICGSFFFTFQILCLERKLYASNRPLITTFVMFLMVIVFMLPFYFLGAPNTEALWKVFASPAEVVALGVLALFCTVGSFMMMNSWQKHITSTEAGLIYCLEPLFSVIFALFLPAVFSVLMAIEYQNEQVSRELVVGGAFLLAANLLLLMQNSKSMVDRKMSPL